MFCLTKRILCLEEESTNRLSWLKTSLVNMKKSALNHCFEPWNSLINFLYNPPAPETPHFLEVIKPLSVVSFSLIISHRDFTCYMNSVCKTTDKISHLNAPTDNVNKIWGTTLFWSTVKKIFKLFLLIIYFFCYWLLQFCWKQNYNFTKVHVICGQRSVFFVVGREILSWQKIWFGCHGLLAVGVFLRNKKL